MNTLVDHKIVRQLAEQLNISPAKMVQKLTGLYQMQLLDKLTLHGMEGMSPKLSVRDLEIFLIFYLHSDVQTIREIGEHTQIGRSGITRGINRLIEFKLLEGRIDLQTQRALRIMRTNAGLRYLKNLQKLVESA